MSKRDRLWGHKLPGRFHELYEKGDFDALRLKDEEEVELPFPLLSVEDIEQQESLREDWEIPLGLLPFMGDMHDLVCLDFSEPDNPTVVQLNDERDKEGLAETFEYFLDHVFVAEEKGGDSLGIVEEGTWFNFKKRKS